METKRQVIAIFEELLTHLWGHLVGVIGTPTTNLIFHSALRETLTTYSFLEVVTIRDDGVQISLSDPELDSVAWHTLRGGLLAFVDSGIDLLTDLTGNILASKLEPMVHGFKSKVGFKEKLIYE